ncbi:uncharacterized protein LOC142347871 [Convolutriloba macropyga]|uniref:uncharacterized protein LOC142347871 n=1 Tax=Convolutriloba macropyga TaxID=536237 RepID=UPI003F524AD4
MDGNRLVARDPLMRNYYGPPIDYSYRSHLVSSQQQHQHPYYDHHHLQHHAATNRAQSMPQIMAQQGSMGGSGGMKQGMAIGGGGGGMSHQHSGGGSSTQHHPGISKQMLIKEQRQVLQLRQEAMLNRLPLSQTIPSLVHFCHSNMQSDPFLNASLKDTNPWVTKKSVCQIV